MSTTEPHLSTSQTVTLRGLFAAAGHFVTELGHPDIESGLYVTCFRGGVQVQVTRAAGTAEDRSRIVVDAARIIGAEARPDEHLHDAADPNIWGSYIAHGHYMEAPVFAWTPLTLSEANRLGWGNVIELPLPENGAGQ